MSYRLSVYFQNVDKNNDESRARRANCIFVGLDSQIDIV